MIRVTSSVAADSAYASGQPGFEKEDFPIANIGSSRIWGESTCLIPVMMSQKKAGKVLAVN